MVDQILKIAEIKENGNVLDNLNVIGNVGIGTTAPSEKLEVSGTVKASKFVGDGSELKGIKTGYWTGVTSGISYDGNVGIRTQSPEFPLVIQAIGGSEELISFKDPSGKNTWHINQSTRTPMKIRGLNFAETGVADARLVILQGGNVGIGTSLPSARLEVIGNIKAKGSELENLYVTGNVGIGTSSPNRPLAIRAREGSEELISFENPIGATKWHINQNLGGKYPGLNFVETGVADGRLYIQEGGNVGIGTTTPSAKLEVDGDIKVSGQIIQEEWHWAKNLKNLWRGCSEGYNPPGYFLDTYGIVHLTGIVRGGLIGQPIFELPAGYRPVNNEIRMTLSSGNLASRCDIMSDGNVIAKSGNNKWFSLDGITFRVTNKRTITENHNGKSITLKNGEIFLLELNETKLEFWELNSISSGLIILNDQGYAGPGYLIHIWEIKAVTQGSQQVKMKSRGHFSPRDFTLNVQVQ